MGYFPWIPSVKKKFAKLFSTDYDLESLNFFFRHVNEELSTILTNECKKNQALFTCLTDFYYHFCRKINWEEPLPHLKSACVQLLASLCKLGIVLSGKNVASKWLSRLLSALRLYPGDASDIYNYLLIVYNVKEQYRSVYTTVLSCVLRSPQLKPEDAPAYVKLILLMRQLKLLLQDPCERTRIKGLACAVATPSDVISWLMSNGLRELCHLKGRQIGRHLMGKTVSQGVLQRLREAVLPVSRVEQSLTIEPNFEVKTPKPKKKSKNAHTLVKTNLPKKMNLDASNKEESIVNAFVMEEMPEDDSFSLGSNDSSVPISSDFSAKLSAETPSCSYTMPNRDRKGAANSNGGTSVRTTGKAFFPTFGLAARQLESDESKKGKKRKTSSVLTKKIDAAGKQVLSAKKHKNKKNTQKVVQKNQMKISTADCSASSSSTKKVQYKNISQKRHSTNGFQVDNLPTSKSISLSKTNPIGNEWTVTVDDNTDSESCLTLSICYKKIINRDVTHDSLYGANLNTFQGTTRKDAVAPVNVVQSGTKNTNLVANKLVESDRKPKMYKAAEKESVETHLVDVCENSSNSLGELRTEIKKDNSDSDVNDKKRQKVLKILQDATVIIKAGETIDGKVNISKEINMIGVKRKKNQGTMTKKVANNAKEFIKSKVEKSDDDKAPAKTSKRRKVTKTCQKEGNKKYIVDNPKRKLKIKKSKHKQNKVETLASGNTKTLKEIKAVESGQEVKMETKPACIANVAKRDTIIETQEESSSELETLKSAKNSKISKFIEKIDDVECIQEKEAKYTIKDTETIKYEKVTVAGMYVAEASEESIVEKPMTESAMGFKRIETSKVPNTTEVIKESKVIEFPLEKEGNEAMYNIKKTHIGDTTEYDKDSRTEENEKAIINKASKELVVIKTNLESTAEFRPVETGKVTKLIEVIKESKAVKPLHKEVLYIKEMPIVEAIPIESDTEASVTVENMQLTSTIGFEQIGNGKVMEKKLVEESKAVQYLQEVLYINEMPKIEAIIPIETDTEALDNEASINNKDTEENIVEKTQLEFTIEFEPVETGKVIELIEESKAVQSLHEEVLYSNEMPIVEAIIPIESDTEASVTIEDAEENIVEKITIEFEPVKTGEVTKPIEESKSVLQSLQEKVHCIIADAEESMGEKTQLESIIEFESAGACKDTKPIKLIAKMKEIKSFQAIAEEQDIEAKKADIETEAVEVGKDILTTESESAQISAETEYNIVVKASFESSKTVKIAKDEKNTEANKKLIVEECSKRKEAIHNINETKKIETDKNTENTDRTLSMDFETKPLVSDTDAEDTFIEIIEESTESDPEETVPETKADSKEIKAVETSLQTEVHNIEETEKNENDTKKMDESTFDHATEEMGLTRITDIDKGTKAFTDKERKALKITDQKEIIKEIDAVLEENMIDKVKENSSIAQEIGALETVENAKIVEKINIAATEVIANGNVIKEETETFQIVKLAVAEKTINQNEVKGTVKQGLAEKTVKLPVAKKSAKQSASEETAKLSVAKEKQYVAEETVKLTKTIEQTGDRATFKQIEAEETETIEIVEQADNELVKVTEVVKKTEKEEIVQQKELFKDIKEINESDKVTKTIKTDETKPNEIMDMSKTAKEIIVEEIDKMTRESSQSKFDCVKGVAEALYRKVLQSKQEKELADSSRSEDLAVDILPGNILPCPMNKVKVIHGVEDVDDESRSMASDSDNNLQLFGFHGENSACLSFVDVYKDNLPGINELENFPTISPAKKIFFPYRNLYTTEIVDEKPDLSDVANFPDVTAVDHLEEERVNMSDYESSAESSQSSDETEELVIQALASPVEIPDELANGAQLEATAHKQDKKSNNQESKGDDKGKRSEISTINNKTKTVVARNLRKRNVSSVEAKKAKTSELMAERPRSGRKLFNKKILKEKESDPSITLDVPRRTSKRHRKDINAKLKIEFESLSLCSPKPNVHPSINVENSTNRYSTKDNADTFEKVKSCPCSSTSTTAAKSKDLYSESPIKENKTVKIFTTPSVSKKTTYNFSSAGKQLPVVEKDDKCETETAKTVDKLPMKKSGIRSAPVMSKEGNSESKTDPLADDKEEKSAEDIDSLQSGEVKSNKDNAKTLRRSKRVAPGARSKADQALIVEEDTEDANVVPNASEGSLKENSDMDAVRDSLAKASQMNPREYNLRSRGVLIRPSRLNVLKKFQDNCS